MESLAAELAAEVIVGLDLQGYAAGVLVDATADNIEQLGAAFVRIGVELYRRAGVRCCRVCGCTEDSPCDTGCTWVGDDLCSAHQEEPRILVVSR